MRVVVKILNYLYIKMRMLTGLWTPPPTSKKNLYFFRFYKIDIPKQPPSPTHPPHLKKKGERTYICQGMVVMLTLRCIFGGACLPIPRFVCLSVCLLACRDKSGGKSSKTSLYSTGCAQAVVTAGILPQV